MINNQIFNHAAYTLSEIVFALLLLFSAGAFQMLCWYSSTALMHGLWP